MPTATKPKLDVKVVSAAQWADIREQVNASYEHVPTIGATGDHGTKIVRADGGRGPVAVELTASGTFAHMVDARTGSPVSRESMSMQLNLRNNVTRARDEAAIILVSASYARAWMLRDGTEGPDAEQVIAELAEGILRELERDTQLLIQSKYTNTYSVQGPGLDAVQTVEVLPDADNTVVRER